MAQLSVLESPVDLGTPTAANAALPGAMGSTLGVAVIAASRRSVTISAPRSPPQSVGQLQTLVASAVSVPET